MSLDVYAARSIKVWLIILMDFNISDSSGLVWVDLLLMACAAGGNNWWVNQRPFLHLTRTILEFTKEG